MKVRPQCLAFYPGGSPVRNLGWILNKGMSGQIDISDPSSSQWKDGLGSEDEAGRSIGRLELIQVGDAQA